MSCKVIKCSKMFDSENQQVLENVMIFVKDNIIEKVCPWTDETEGYELIDLTDKFVTPGLIDCHVHLSSNGEANPSGGQKTLGDHAFFMMRMAQADLMAGFTTLRSVGDPGFNDVALRNAIDRGEVVGPRLLVSGPCIGTTGGHADSHYNPYITESPVAGSGQICDGADAMLKAARYNVKHGVDVLKFMSTGGVMSKGTTVGAQQMTFEEMRAVCEIAEMYGVITATHAHGTNGIKCAVKAGVTSVEHGMMLDDECIEEMAKRGTFLVPTIIAAERIIVMGAEAGIPQYMVDKAKQVLANHRNGVTKARAAGVKLAFGTDSGTPYNFHGKQGYEFQLMQEFDIPVLEALTCATKNASELIRRQDTVGSITAGKFADIAAFDGDPREDITAMTRCEFVMKNGVVYKG